MLFCSLLWRALVGFFARWGRVVEGGCLKELGMISSHRWVLVRLAGGRYFVASTRVGVWDGQTLLCISREVCLCTRACLLVCWLACCMGKLRVPWSMDLLSFGCNSRFARVSQSPSFFGVDCMLTASTGSSLSEYRGFVSSYSRIFIFSL